ncbi:MAG: HDOD domain-containing protein [Fibrobacteria bacterium]
MFLDQAKRVKRITDSLISLPTLPTVIAKMLELVDNPKTSASSLSNLIMRDQVLTAKILKMANSSFYAFPRQIATVKLALVVLGFENVKEMALSLSVFNSFKGENNKHFDTSLFWQHSVSVGACTRMLARETCYRLAGEAFVAGLLHDIGKVVLNQYLPQEFAQIQTLIFEGGRACDDAELEVLGVTHAEVGAWLAERWNLPVILVEAIRYHQHPDQCPRNAELPLLVYLGDYLSVKCNLGKSGSKGVETLPAAILEMANKTLSLTPESLESFRGGLFAEYDKASSFMMEAA